MRNAQTLLPASPWFPVALLVVLGGCGEGTPADEAGVAASCSSTDECPVTERFGEESVQLVCLTQFTGGYCGLPNCATAEDCPLGSTCVLHDDGETYCFRECFEKPECNLRRAIDEEANCSSNFDFNDPADDVGQKACVPPSSGL